MNTIFGQQTRVQTNIEASTKDKTHEWSSSSRARSTPPRNITARERREQRSETDGYHAVLRFERGVRRRRCHLRRRRGRRREIRRGRGQRAGEVATGARGEGGGRGGACATTRRDRGRGGVMDGVGARCRGRTGANGARASEMDRNARRVDKASARPPRRTDDDTCVSCSRTGGQG